MQEMTLKEVCNMVGVTRRAVQCYEQEGLVASTGRNKYGYLLYDEEELDKIRTIRQYQDFGFAIKEIKELLVVSEEMYLVMMNEKLTAMRQKHADLVINISRMEKLLSEREK